MQRNGKTPGAPAQYASAYRIHLVNRESGFEQRLCEVGDVGLCAARVTNLLRQRRRGRGGERRRAAGE